ncbi:MAG: fimbrillin family protein [Tidjanibacter sp.]|nr:fimbrillin family protein [Tidjanibacter sp.]
MKKLIAIAAACVALASCVKNEVDFSGNFAQGERIDFQAVQSVPVENRGAFEGDSFIAAAFLLNEGETWAGAHSTAQPYFQNETVTNTSGDWTTGTAYYWPARGSLTFFAVAPTGFTATREWNTNKDYVISGYSVETNKNVDLRVADIVREAKGNDVPAVFRHKLTKLNFGITKAASDPREIKLKSIVISGVYSEGTYTMPYNTIHGSGTVVDFWTVPDGASSETCTLFSGDLTVTDATQEITIDHSYVIPQEFTSASYLTVVYTVTNNGATETVTVKKHLGDDIDTADKMWSMNENISYNFTIGAVEQIMWAPSQEDWTDQSFTIEL